jgi:hypothetical protein
MCPSRVAMLRLAVALILCGCDSKSGSFIEDITGSTVLIDGLHSLESPDAVRSSRQLNGYEWEVREDSRSPARLERPVFEDLIVVVKRYRSGGVEGELMLEFVNRRLATSTFYPDDYDRFAASLKAVRLTLNKEGQLVYAMPASSTVITVGTDVKGRKFVSWEDIRIMSAVRRWVQRYS